AGPRACALVFPEPVAGGDRLGVLGVGRVHEMWIPPLPALALALRLAVQVGGGAIVDVAPVGRPRPPPLQVGAGHARRIRLAARREVLIPRREAPAVDPRRARRRAVVLQLAESLQVLLGIPGHVAVDLPQELEGADLPRVE